MNKIRAQQLLTQVQQDYDRIAEHFSHTRNRQWNEVRDLIHQYVQVGDQILDLGCGNGRVADLVDEIKGQYVGMDVSAGLIAQAQKLHPTKTFLVGSMLELPFADNAVDQVLMIASLHHIPSAALRIQVLQEVHRVLKDDGYILMTNWNLHQWRFVPLRWRWNAGKLLGRSDMDWNDVLVPWKNANKQVQADRYYHGFTRRELRRIAKLSGFSVVDQYYQTNGRHLPRSTAHNIVTVLQK